MKEREVWKAGLTVKWCDGSKSSFQFLLNSESSSSFSASDGQRYVHESMEK